MGEQLIRAFVSLGNSIVSAIPRVSVGILLVILGVAVARLAESLLRTMLIRLRFDSLIQKAGVGEALRRIGLRQHLSLFFPKLAYFLVLFLAVKTASDAFGLVAISNAIGVFFSYLTEHPCGAFALDFGHDCRPVRRTDGDPRR